MDDRWKDREREGMTGDGGVFLYHSKGANALTNAPQNHKPVEKKGEKTHSKTL